MPGGQSLTARLLAGAILACFLSLPNLGCEVSDSAGPDVNTAEKRANPPIVGTFSPMQVGNEWTFDVRDSGTSFFFPSRFYRRSIQIADLEDLGEALRITVSIRDSGIYCDTGLFFCASPLPFDSAFTWSNPRVDKAAPYFTIPGPDRFFTAALFQYHKATWNSRTASAYNSSQDTLILSQGPARFLTEKIDGNMRGATVRRHIYEENVGLIEALYSSFNTGYGTRITYRLAAFRMQPPPPYPREANASASRR